MWSKNRHKQFVKFFDSAVINVAEPGWNGGSRRQKILQYNSEINKTGFGITYLQICMSLNTKNVFKIITFQINQRYNKFVIKIHLKEIEYMSFLYILHNT
jgi:hypothetical protein